MSKDYSSMRKEELLEHRKQIIKEISRFHNLQMATKIKLNSAYGAL